MEYSAYVYEVQVHYGKNLPKMDVTSDIDPYVMVQFPDHVAKTRTFENQANPVWDSPVDLLIGEAPKDWTLKVELWDRDKASKDDHVCDIKLPRSELPITRREFPVDKKGGVICISVSFFCAPSCAKTLLKEPVIYVKASDGQDWHAPVPAAEQFSVGLHYSNAGDPLMYIAQTDPASILNSFARFVAVEDAAADNPAENTITSHFLVGGASLVSVSDASRVDVLRRIGGPKGLRVFGEVQLLAPGSVPLNKLAVKIARKRTLVAIYKLSDIAKDASWSRTTTKYSDAKAAVKNCVLDDENELVYFDQDPRFTVSTTCSFASGTVVAYLKAGNPGIYIDMIHSSANERNIVEYNEPVPLVGGKVNVMSKITIADPPNVMHFDQVYIMVYKEEDIVTVPVLSVLPLA